MVLDLLAAHRLKGAAAHMKQKLASRYPALSEPPEDLGCKMQAGRRRSYGACMAGIDGLVASFVLR
jgi:hypothetical protein